MAVITRDRRTRRDMYRLIRNLPPEDVEKVASYAAFLTYQRNLEDAEDLRVAQERRNEPSVPLRDLLKEMSLD